MPETTNEVDVYINSRQGRSSHYMTGNTEKGIQWCFDNERFDGTNDDYIDQVYRLIVEAGLKAEWRNT